MPYVILRTVTGEDYGDGDGIPSVPDEIFGPFKNMATAEAAAKKLFFKQQIRIDDEHSAIEADNSLCRCKSCIEEMRREGNLDTGMVNFMVFPLRSPKSYMEQYHDGEEV